MQIVLAQNSIEGAVTPFSAVLIGKARLGRKGLFALRLA